MPKQLFGLVLAGGQSSRMGEDKGLIVWHGQQQRYYLAELLGAHCEKVFISCRTDQVNTIKPNYDVIVDKTEDTDSYGAIMSALSEYSNVGWLIVACDMPFIDHDSISQLVKERDTNKISTAYYNPKNNLPEPLFAIWESRSFDMLKMFSKEGINCPRKALIKSGDKIKLVRPLDNRIIMNVNTPEDANVAKEIIDGYK